MLAAAVCAALAAICKLISPDLINAVLPRTLELLNHHKELVRKKAVMALHRYLQLDPEREGPLSGVDLDRHLRQALCDKASTCMLLHKQAASDACHHHKQEAALFSNQASEPLAGCDLLTAAAGPICDECRPVCTARSNSTGPKAI